MSLVSANPCDQLERPKATPAPPRGLTATDIKKLLEQSKDKSGREPVMSKPELRVVLAQPRGFCAGVERAITIVERALERFGPPVYVRHEIVHNKQRPFAASPVPY